MPFDLSDPSLAFGSRPRSSEMVGGGDLRVFSVYQLAGCGDERIFFRIVAGKVFEQFCGDSEAADRSDG